MSDEEPKQTPTPDQTPSKAPKRPDAPDRADSEVSTTEMDDSGYRSRSQSRRRRRQNQRQRQSAAKAQAGNAQADSMASIGEAEAEEEEDQPQSQAEVFQQAQAQGEQLPKEQWMSNPHPSEITGEMQPFERIKPPSQSMDGPVNYARALRGEVPWKGAPPAQPLDTAQNYDGKAGGKDMMDYDGLKLKIELNLDIEVEIKASIHGDLTLALL